MKVFLWVGIHQGEGLMGDVYVFAHNLVEAREILKKEFVNNKYPIFWQDLLHDEPTTVFDEPMAWIDEHKRDS